jgi:hypothetical protein
MTPQIISQSSQTLPYKRALQLTYYQGSSSPPSWKKEEKRICDRSPYPTVRQLQGEKRTSKHPAVFLQSSAGKWGQNIDFPGCHEDKKENNG